MRKILILLALLSSGCASIKIPFLSKKEIIDKKPITVSLPPVINVDTLDYYLEEMKDTIFKEVEIKDGDVLSKFCQSEWRKLERINKVKAEYLQIGAKIKVPKNCDSLKNWSPLPKFIKEVDTLPQFVLVDLESQFMAGYEKGKQKFWNPISSGLNSEQTPENYRKKDAVRFGYKFGDEFKTPTGFFKAGWRDSEHVSNIYDVSMPYSVNFANILASDGRKVDLFFHGGDIARFPASHGCIRMFTDDAASFYRWSKHNTPVLIVEKKKDISKKLKLLKAP